MFVDSIEHISDAEFQTNHGADDEEKDPYFLGKRTEPYKINQTNPNDLIYDLSLPKMQADLDRKPDH